MNRDDSAKGMCLIVASFNIRRLFLSQSLPALFSIEKLEPSRHIKFLPYPLDQSRISNYSRFQVGVNLASQS